VVDNTNTNDPDCLITVLFHSKFAIVQDHIVNCKYQKVPCPECQEMIALIEVSN